jgi:hypothetical protein
MGIFTRGYRPQDAAFHVIIYVKKGFYTRGTTASIRIPSSPSGQRKSQQKAKKIPEKNSIPQKNIIKTLPQALDEMCNF